MIMLKKPLRTAVGVSAHRGGTIDSAGSNSLAVLEEKHTERRPNFQQSEEE